MPTMARLAHLAPFFFVFAACSLEKSGGLPETPDTGITDGGKPDVLPDVAPDSPACGPCTKADEFCKGGVCTLLTGCSEIHAVDSTAPSKVYIVKPTPVANPIPVWCEMAEGGGGWTLIASTHPSGVAPFGWSSPASDPSVGVKTAAYALDLSAGFVFTKAMLTGHLVPSAVQISPPVVTFDLPPLGPLGGSTTNTANLKVVTPTSSCTTGDVPQTLAVFGRTSLTTSFYFSTSNAITDVGIFPNGFLSAGASGCGVDQFLHGKQVMLFGHE